LKMSLISSEGSTSEGRGICTFTCRCII
jgi:hypothetical protein